GSIGCPFIKIRAESFAFEYIRITLKSLNFKLITTTNFDYLFQLSLAIVAGKFINNENTVIHINTVYKSSGEGEQCICISWVFVALLWAL
ncbi:MAG: hypothetical protein E6710_06775, partial [Acinetobacter baumannii]|nr:hypothetical protein [Acinetobacter baumannii]